MCWPEPTPSLTSGNRLARSSYGPRCRVVTITVMTRTNRTIETGAKTPRSAELLVMRLRTTVITARTVVIQASTVIARGGSRRNGPAPALARMAPAIKAESRPETAATIRPDGASAPLVPPPCVYSPHGAPKTSTNWKAATSMNPAAARHAAMRLSDEGRVDTIRSSTLSTPSNRGQGPATGSSVGAASSAQPVGRTGASVISR